MCTRDSVALTAATSLAFSALVCCRSPCAGELVSCSKCGSGQSPSTRTARAASLGAGTAAPVGVQLHRLRGEVTEHACHLFNY